MNDLTRSESKYLKHPDLEAAVGKPWEEIRVVATCEWTKLGDFPDGKPAYLMKFARLDKPLHLNKTNLRTLSEMFPDVADFPSSAFEGQRFMLIVVETEMGPGIRIRPARDTTQEATQAARERISRAQQEHVPAEDCNAPPPESGPDENGFASEEIPPPGDLDEIPF